MPQLWTAHHIHIGHYTLTTRTFNNLRNYRQQLGLPRDHSTWTEQDLSKLDYNAVRKCTGMGKEALQSLFGNDFTNIAMWKQLL